MMKTTYKLITALLASILATSSYAVCDTIFSCTVKGNHKKVQVCDDDNGYITYRFGRNLNSPEMKLTLPYHRTSISHWWDIGAGRWHNNILNLPNGNTTYSLFTSLDTHTHAFQSGILVEVNGRQVAELKCIDDTLYSDLENVDYLPRTRW